MLLALNRFPADLAAWSEGCSCHPWLQYKSTRPSKSKPPRHDPDKNIEIQAGEILDALRREIGLKAGSGDGGMSFGPCPLAGQRSMDLATGAVWKLLDAWSEEYIQDLLQNNECRDEAEVSSALTEF